jgi:hypothetical protein
MRSLVTHFVLGFCMSASAAWADTAPPHPACFDYYHAAPPDIDGFFPNPISLVNCSNTDKMPPETQEGFLTHNRGTDSAGMSLGYIGYQYIEGAKQDVLYILLKNSGGNSSYLELLVGHQDSQAKVSQLRNARSYGIPSDCQSLTAGWSEPNGKIRIALNLNLADVMRVLVAPSGQLPEIARDDRTLKNIFAKRYNSAMSAVRESCIGNAEYELDPDQLTWQLQSLRFDLNSEEDRDAYSTLRNLVPHMQTNNVAVFLQTELNKVRASLLELTQRPQLFPKDDSALDLSYLQFIGQLKSAIQNRDIEKMVSLAHPEIMLGHGGSGGQDDFKVLLSSPTSADDYWQTLKNLIELGGIKKSNDVFCLPYISCLNVVPLNANIYGTFVVTQPNIAPHARPSDLSAVLKVLHYDVVELVEPFFIEKDTFARVRLYDGHTGYIDRKALRSPLDFRMEVIKHADQWQIKSFFGGD